MKSFFSTFRRQLGIQVALCFVASAGVAQADIFDGLLNYYNLDGNFNDSAGSLAGNISTFDDHGSQPGESVTFAPAASAGLGQYGVFNGDAEAFVEVPDSEDISISGRDLSISLWVNVNQFDQGWQAAIAHGESNDYRIARRGGASNIMSYAGGVGDIPTNDTTGPNVNDGAWHHVVAISPVGAPVELWVDGAQVAVGGNTNLNANGSGRMMIGGNPDTAGDGFRTWDGGIDDIGMWERALTGPEIGQIYTAGVAGVSLAGVPDFAGVLPPFDVGGRDLVGSVNVAGIRNAVYGEPSGDLVPGLGQSWYAVANPGTHAGINEIALSNDRAVPYFQSEGGTWWSGSDTVSDVQNYPSETDGMARDNYSVKLEGQIRIEQSGPVRFLDGVDDYTYLAIDTDRSGVAGDSASEVLINDNSWTNALSQGSANGGAPIVEVDFQNIAAGGEWLAIEFNMAEGGGGDSGMLYWDALDEDGFFPLEQGEGIVDEDAAIYLVPDSHLRSYENPPALVSGTVNGEVASRDTGWEIDVNPADGSSDAFGLANPDPNFYTTILDVDGIEFHINPLGDVAAGSSFRIFNADQIVGTPMIATEGWSYNAATGSIVFGQGGGGLQGDIDGDGEVAFADFLILSSNFGNAGGAAQGDIDGDGQVGFGDFLILSANFGQTGSVAAVPEPSALALIGLGSMLLGLTRRRRS